MGDHLGLAVAPARQRVGPLASVADLVCVAAEGDRVAVHDAGDDRRQLARSRDHQRLVDQPQSVLDSSLPEQRTALLVAGQPDQVRVAEALADRGRIAPRWRSRPPSRRAPSARARRGPAASPVRRNRARLARATVARGRTNLALEPSRRETACCGRPRTRIARPATSRRSPGAVDAPAPSRRHSRHRGRACMPSVRTAPSPRRPAPPPSQPPKAPRTRPATPAQRRTCGPVRAAGRHEPRRDYRRRPIDAGPDGLNKP